MFETLVITPAAPAARRGNRPPPPPPSRAGPGARTRAAAGAARAKYGFSLPAPLLARMLQFGDSMLPVGGFAFSGGLEAAVQQGVVHDVETLRQFTLTALEQAAKGDAVAVAWAMRAVTRARENGEQNAAETLGGLCRIDRDVFARKLTEETRLMSVRMGKKLAEMGAHVTGLPLVAAWLERVRENLTPGTFPVTQGLLFADLGMTMEQALVAHQYGVAMVILNASLRLMRVTHLDTQAVLFGLGPAFAAHIRLASELPLAQMSNYAPMTDILAAVHVQAHVRLFMN